LGEQPVPNKKKKIEHNRNIDDRNMSEDEIGNFDIVERV
jgi:hypothetical protein